MFPRYSPCYFQNLSQIHPPFYRSTSTTLVQVTIIATTRTTSRSSYPLSMLQPHPLHSSLHTTARIRCLKYISTHITLIERRAKLSLTLTIAYLALHDLAPIPLSLARLFWAPAGPRRGQICPFHEALRLLSYLSITLLSQPPQTRSSHNWFFIIYNSPPQGGLFRPTHK